MIRNAAFILSLAYFVLSPFVAAAAFGSETAYYVVSALNFGLSVGWGVRNSVLKIEIGSLK